MNSSFLSFIRAALVAMLVLLVPRGSALGAAEADMLVAFDNSYYDGVGGIENAKVNTANSVAASNWINEISGTPARVRIVGYHATTGQGGRSSLGGYCGWMWNYGDGYLDDVTAAADAIGADLVSFICAPGAGEGAAAVAYQPGRYAAYGPANFWNNVVAHESGGHNYGCDHSGCRTNPTTILMHNYCGGGSQPYYSNPNIWLNGVQLFGGMNLGNCTFTGGADNAYHISTTAQATADAWPRRVWGSNLAPIVHRWQFNKPAGAAPAGTTVASDVGGAPATVRGQGAAFTGTGLRLPGGTTGNMPADTIAAYIDLPNGIFKAMPSFTVEIWATPRAGSAWARVFEIGRTVEAGDGLGAAGEWTGTPGSAGPLLSTSGSDVIGISIARSSGTLTGQRFIAGLNGTTQQADSDLATTAGEMHHYAITFADTAVGATVKWFRNGALIKTLDVPFNSADLEDVNNWLGRSLWSGDTQAQIDYHDVRIQSVALADGSVMANYRIGPHDAVSTMRADDAYGSSGFVSGAWEFGGTPVGTRDYETGALMLRTPRNANPVTFPGRSLTITGGNLHLNGLGGPRTTTINDLRLKGGTVGSFAEGDTTQTLAGNIKLSTWDVNQIRGGWGEMVVSANISTTPGGSGNGVLLFTEKRVTLTGSNTGYTGVMWVGDGRFSTLRISSETQLGGNPAAYYGDALALNRGILETTATMTIDDPNRGVRIGPSGGIFRPAAGTTLTIASPLTSPASGNTPQTAPLFPNPVVGYFFKESAGTLVLTNPNNSYIGEMHINEGTLRLEGAGRFNNGDHHMPLRIAGTLNLDTTADQILGGAISGGGTIIKNNTGTTSFYGANPFTGSVTINAGTVFARATNAATNRSFSHVSGITVHSGATLRSQANSLFGWDGTQAKPITVHAGGTLTTSAANDDVNVGAVTLHGGTLAGFASAQWGSWNFRRVPGGKLVATENSTVTAPNVGLGPNNTVEVSAGKTLTWSGALTNLSSEGTVALVKSNGAGTLTLAAANTYTGPTTINAGTLNLTGSLAAGSAVTVAGGATLTGAGTVGGTLSFAANAVHAPGDAATGLGTQNVGAALSYGAGARVKFALGSNSDAAGAASRVSAPGTVTVAAGAAIDLTFNASGSTTNFFDPFWTQPRSWPVVASSGGGMSGTFALGTVSADSGARSAASYGTFGLSQGPGGATLQWTPHAFTTWRGARFGAGAGNAATADFLANPDGDALANAWEYFHATDPLAGTVTPLQARVIEGRAALTFPRNTQASDILIKVQGADAPGGPWSDLAQSAAGAPFTAAAPGVGIAETGADPVRSVQVSDRYPVAEPLHPQRFFRLWIQQQP